MKIRSKFVSNSSSSSFAAIVQPLSLEDILDWDNVHNPYALGFSDALLDGEDLFELKPEMREAIRNMGKASAAERLQLNYYDLIKASYEYNELEFDVAKLPDGKITVIYGDVDYHTTDTVEQFVSRYIEKENYW